jgi:hypothetical protein
MAQQTAVDWLVSELNHCLESNGKIEVVPELLVKLQEQAKQMDKEQKIEFAKQCLNKALDTDIRTAYKKVEQYYNETYGTTDRS